MRKPGSLRAARVILRSCPAIVALLTLSTSRAQPAKAPPEDLVVLLSIEGKADLAPAGTDAWAPATNHQVIHLGDRLRTDKFSRAIIRFSKWGQLRVREASLFTIEPPREPGRRPLLNLLKGFFYFFNRDKAIEVDLQSRLASAATRGTEFQVAVAEDGRMEVSVLEGVVDLRNDLGTVTLSSFQQGVALPGQHPTTTAVIVSVNVIQWCLYYPAVLDVDELGLSEDEQSALKESLEAWRSGNLPKALQSYPENREPASERERVYRAALLLVVGETAQAESLLPSADMTSPFGNALREMSAAVQFQTYNSAAPTPVLATEWLAQSYYQQSRAGVDLRMLEEALKSAQTAAAVAPNFGLAWERLAELEFSFGRTGKAFAALDNALRLSPRNAQALTLKGFLLSAQNRIPQAIDYFDQAIAADGALGNAWLGRGLCRIRQGKAAEGREDLLVAATLEPQRAVLRSYLGKAFSDAGEDKRARKELDLARTLDPKDPTSWLYSALDHEQHNRINEAIRDLEQSKELNDNRSLYRSDLLLDQDRAVRSANLARIYGEAGMDDVALREASRAVAADYGNFSAHLFLANSYDQLRQANLFDLRFETPAFSEYLLASLLGPADGRLLAQPVSQQEYTRLFEHDTLGLSTSTEYLSRGAWSQYAAQYGTFRNSSFALEENYHWDPGQTPNGDLETRQFSFKFKQMLTPHDGLFFQVFDFRQTSGDLAQRYDPSQAVAGLRSEEKQEPSLVAGLDHQWSDTQRTLLLVSRFNSSLQQTNPHGSVFLLTETFGVLDGFHNLDLAQDYHSRLTVDSFELQHLVSTPDFQALAGVRLQTDTDRLSNLQALDADNSPGYGNYFGSQGDVVTNQMLRVHSLRISPYVYGFWQIARPLWLITGASFDYQSQPRNALFAPLGDGEEIHRQFSPKAALVWTPVPRASVRAAYSRSLGGFDLDQSVRLEPTQLAGFVQAYRNLFPDSLVGGVAGAGFETADASLEYRLPTRTYLALSGQLLRSGADHDLGAYEGDLFGATGMGLQVNEQLRFQERSIEASVHQLLGDWVSVGARYRLSDARLTQMYPDIPIPDSNKISRGLLQLVSLNANLQHSSGFFAGVEGNWWSQELSEGLGGMPGDNFWQVNLLAGYRSPRRHAEITAGVLNVASRDYRLYPINLYPDLPRSRTAFVSLQLNF